MVLFFSLNLYFHSTSITDSFPNIFCRELFYYPTATHLVCKLKLFFKISSDYKQD